MALRILILSYHYPPFNVTASQRALSFARYLPQHGIHTEVLTFDWPGDHSDDHIQVHRLPLGKLEQKAHPHWSLRIPGISTFRVLWHLASGTPDYQLQPQRKAMQDWLDAEDLSRFDCLLAIYSPHFHLEHACAIHRKTGIPFVVDFRDLFDDRLLQKNATFSFRERIIHYLHQKNWKRWMKDADGFTSVSEAMDEFLNGLFHKESAVVYNGFEASDVRPYPPFEVFTITLIGTLVEWRQLGVILGGISEFYKELNPVSTVIIAGIHPLTEMYLKTALRASGLEDDPRVELHPRIPRKKALEITGRAHINAIPPAVGFQGVYSSRVFEFLATGNQVLVAPKGDEALDSLVGAAPNGKIGSDIQEVAHYLRKMYERHCAGENLRCEVGSSEYTRSRQAERMAQFITKVSSGTR